MKYVVFTNTLFLLTVRLCSGVYISLAEFVIRVPFYKKMDQEKNTFLVFSTGFKLTQTIKQAIAIKEIIRCTGIQ